MSTNFDDLVIATHSPAASLESISFTLTTTTNNTIATASTISSHSPPNRPLTFALDDPLNNPFADLPSSNSITSNDEKENPLQFNNFSIANEKNPTLKATLSNSLDPLSSHFENLSLSSPNLDASPASLSYPSQLSASTTTTTPYASSQNSTLPIISRSHATSTTPMDNSAILFPSVKETPSFLAQEILTLQPEDNGSSFHDPLLNPPEQRPTTTSSSPTTSPSLTPHSPLSSKKYTPPNTTTTHSPPSPTLQTSSPLPFPTASSDPTVQASFFVSVTDPIKISDPISPYVVYRVSSKRMLDGPSTEYVVSRRYTEFLWLYHQLLTAYPGLIIPSVPEKQAVGRFQDTFIEHRRFGLNRFLLKVANHPILNKDPQFLTFLQSETISHKGQEKPVPLPSKLKVHDPDKYFVEKLHATETYEGLLKALLKSLDTLALKHQELSKLHGELSELLQMFAEVEEPNPLFLQLQLWAHVHDQVHTHHLDVTTSVVTQYVFAIEDQLRTCHAVKLAFHARTLKLHSLQNLENIMQKKRASLSRTNVSPPTVVSELDNLTVALQAASQSFQDTTRQLEHELERIDKERYGELASSIQTLFESMAAKQQNLAFIWETFYKQLPAVH